MKIRVFVALAFCVSILNFAHPSFAAFPTPVNDQITDSAPEVRPVKIGTKWGFAEPGGKVVVAPRFDEARNFSEGRAAVKLNGRWGFINHSGKIVVAPRYDAVSDFIHGKALVSRSNQLHWITARINTPHSQPPIIPNNAGQWVIVGATQSRTDAELYPVRVGKKWGFADAAGKMAVPAALDDFEGRKALFSKTNPPQYFKNGMQTVEIGGHWTHLHHSVSSILFAPQKLSKHIMQGTQIPIPGFVSGAAETKFQARQVFDKIGAFRGGLAPALKNDRVYYIHPDGSIAFGGFKIAGTDLERKSFILTPKLEDAIGAPGIDRVYGHGAVDITQ